MDSIVDGVLVVVLAIGLDVLRLGQSAGGFVGRSGGNGGHGGKDNLREGYYIIR